MPQLRSALVAMLLLLAAAPALAQWRDWSYAEIAKMPLALADVDKDGVFAYRYRVGPGDGHKDVPASAQLRIQVGGKTHPLAIGADGVVEIPVRKDWAESGAVLQHNQPERRINILLAFRARTPAGVRMSYGRLTESAPVMERGIGKMAGMMRFMAPKVRSFKLRFDASGPQSLTLTPARGKPKAWKTDAEGVLRLPWNAGWTTAQVQLSAPLKTIEPVVE